MKKTILTALLSALTLPAAAAQFYVVVPVPNRTATAGNIQVALNAVALPGAIAGRAYPGFDFNTILQVTGDPNFAPAGVVWRVVSGTLPAGLALSSDGRVSGTPAAAGTSSIELQATYKTKAGQQAYQVIVGEVRVSLAPASAPAGIVGQPYLGFDLTSNLTVSGDHTYQGAGAGVSWSVVAGALPAGLALGSNTGVISGAPSVVGSASVTVKAEYDGASATQAYTFSVAAQVKQFSGYRAWADGTTAASCKEYLDGKPGYRYAGATGTGMYRIDVDAAGPLTHFDVECDMTTDGGGWTVFQRRINGTVDFYRTFAEYASGFGNSAEYWMGNDRMAVLTASGAKALRIDMARTDGQTAYALYTGFKISTAADAYRLTVTWSGGPAGDALSYHSGQRFSAKDVDNDSTDEQACAARYKGGWWYNACHYANLNGEYVIGSTSTDAQGVEWYQWGGHFVESLARTAMKVR